MSTKRALLLSVTLGVILSVAAFSLAALEPVAAQGPSVQAGSGNPDQELVMIRNQYLAVYDPYAMDGTNFVSFYRDGGSTRWRDVAAGDFNGDGDDEIAVINSASVDPTDDIRRVIRVYDPVSGPLPELYWNQEDYTTGDHAWWHIATGDVNGDGKDELVAVEAVRRGVSNFSVFAPDRPIPLLCTATVYSGAMNGLTLADLDDNGRAEIMLGGHAGDAGRIWFFGVQDGNSTCQKLYGSTSYDAYPGTIYDLGTGDVDGDGEEEALMAAHPGVLDEETGEELKEGSPEDNYEDYHSLGIWTYWERDPEDRSNWWKYSYPGWGYGIHEGQGYEFQWGYIDAGDLNADGDDEVVAIRNPHGDVDAMIVLDPRYTSDSTKLSKSFFSDSDSNEFESVKVGNYDGTGRELIALLHRNKIMLYRVYISSGKVTISLVKTWTNTFTGFRDEETKAMAVGDFDGSRLRADTTEWRKFQDDQRSQPDGVTSFRVYYNNLVSPVFSATLNPPAPWLEVSPMTGSVPQTITLRMHSEQLGSLYAIPIGEVSTTLRITGTLVGFPTRGEISIPVTLNVVDEIERVFLPYSAKNGN